MNLPPSQTTGCVCLSVSLSARLSVSVFVCLSVCWVRACSLQAAQKVWLTSRSGKQADATWKPYALPSIPLGFEKHALFPLPCPIQL